MKAKTKTTATKEEAKPALVPELRFPEFRNTEAWAPTTIGALGSFYYGKSAPKWSLSVDAPTPCVRYGELYTKFGPVITETFSRTNTDPETLRFSNGGEILVPRVGEKPEDFGKCCSYLPLKDIAIGEMISVFETKQDPLFYTYYFRNLYKQFAKVVEGQNVKNLYYVELEPLAIYRPSIPEQQKIAECLSSVDELMAAQARKVDALKTHKKGLMQQLFPREGETQPRLRFPEFQNAGAWEEDKIISLSSEPLSNGVFNDPKKVGTGYKLINVSDMYIETTIDENRLSLLELSPSEFEGNQVITGDIFFTRSSLVKSGIAVSNIYLGSSSDVTYDGHLIRFRANTRKVIPLFAHYLFKTALIREQLIARGKTATMTTIGQADVASVTLFFPKPPEQQRIATCLSSLDALITAETQKHETLKTHKKGLMQQLFPSPEEVEA